MTLNCWMQKPVLEDISILSEVLSKIADVSCPNVRQGICLDLPKSRLSLHILLEGHMLLEAYHSLINSYLMTWAEQCMDTGGRLISYPFHAVLGRDRSHTCSSQKHLQETVSCQHRSVVNTCAWMFMFSVWLCPKYTWIWQICRWAGGPPVHVVLGMRHNRLHHLPIWMKGRMKVSCFFGIICGL